MNALDVIEAQTAELAPELTEKPRSELELALVKKMETGRAALPVLPRVATHALKLAGNPEASVSELGRLIDGDPPIAARFLSVANSVIYFRGLRTSSTQAAIVRLGLQHTRDLLFQVVYAASMTGLKRFHEQVRRSFDRSVVCALAARQAAEMLSIDLDSAYMCGLLHDIGEARIYRILEELRPPPGGDGEIAELVAAYHCRAGAEVAKAWQLPAEIVDACALHHEPGECTPHVRVVKISDAVADAVEGNFDPDRFLVLGLQEGAARDLVNAALPPGKRLPPSNRPSGVSMRSPDGPISRAPR
ncbi:MAG TPA: HDOD domain-containing protein [Polyangiaceae bacterium]|jgi:putative nucleotidyltransferase with HDIG domain|nr:HDOD domain-containing protein [Polyangiaceae bacterium]